MKNKKGRKPYPEHMRGKTTSLRLRPDRLEMFKFLGGTQWLNVILDTLIWEKTQGELDTKGQVSPRVAGQ
jgi:hypothetical protein